jgi:hypothetical protein
MIDLADYETRKGNSMVTDIDLGLDYDELEQEANRANRPSFNHNPISWEGDLVSITTGQSVNDKTGEIFPRHSFNFDKVKFLDVGNAVGEYTDGQSYSLLIRPITPEQKQKRTTRFTELGKSALASGKNLDKFVGQRVKVTELTENYKTNPADRYDKQSYSWKFEQVGAVVTAPVEIPPELTEAALALIAKAEVPLTQAGFAMLAMRTPATNQNATLNGKFADGQFIREMVASGRVIDTDGVLTVAAS